MSQTERIYYINKLLSECGHFTTKEVAEHYGVSTRQVKRDIEYLRDRIQYDIVYDRDKRWYHGEGNPDYGSHLDERLLVFNAIIKSLGKSQEIVPVLYDMFTSSFMEGIDSSLHDMMDRVVFINPFTDVPDYGIFAIVFGAMKRGNRLSIDYTTINGTPIHRHVEGLRIVSYENSWYLICYDCQMKKLRNYHLSRIEKIVELEEKCTWEISDEDMDSYINSGYGMFLGSDVRIAKIKFTGWAQYRVKTQTWHRDQTFEMYDGYSILTVPFFKIPELNGKILGFGSYAQPLEPQDLVDAWRNEIEKMKNL